MKPRTRKITGDPLADDLRAMEENLLSHFSYLARQTRGMEVIDTPEYLLVNSGLPSDNFNIIYCRGPWRASCKAALRKAIDSFRPRGFPFAVWVGPESQAAFSATLLELGLKQGPPETGMLLRLGAFTTPTSPLGLTIEQVGDAARLGHFARVIAADDLPPDTSIVEQFFRQAHDALLSPDCPVTLFVGYRGGQPVATCEVLIADQMAGVYSVSTLKAHRRRGIGSAMTARAVQEAIRRGCRLAALQASAEGKGIYAKLGFKASCQFVHFH
jgi:GNAT superfamily N-acetyltransferase